MDTTTNIRFRFVILSSLFTSYSANANDDSKFLNSQSVNVHVSIANSSMFVLQPQCNTERKKKSYRELYARIAKSEWYNNAYNNKSIGEMVKIED